MSPKTVKALLLSFLALTAVSVSACNTVEGAGEDIQSGGQAIERSAEETKKSM